MAKFVHSVKGDFDLLLKKIENGVLNGSVSATLEDSWNAGAQGSRCAVRVFERYSYAGGNRVSMSVTLYQEGPVTHICAITSGGSQAVFFKVNTWGEEAFLDTLKDIVIHL